METLKQMANFFLGKTQFPPLWMDKLPRFMLPTYTGHYSYRWFFIEFKTPDGIGGDTLFSVWRRRLYDM